MKAILVYLPITIGVGCILMVVQPHLDDHLPTIAVVFGYHFFLTQNISAENYASNIATVLEQFPDLRYVVVTGANTRPGDSPFSEAGVLKNALQRLGIRVPVITEEHARNTIENLRYSAALVGGLESHLPPGTQIVLFSDSFQRPRIWWYASHYFPGRQLSFIGIPLWKERLQWQRGIR